MEKLTTHQGPQLQVKTTRERLQEQKEALETGLFLLEDKKKSETEVKNDAKKSVPEV